MSAPSFRASLKNLEVEEVIDLFLHRPLGYAFARLAYPTSLSADTVTLLSMVAGLIAAVFYARGPLTGHSGVVLGGVFFTVSAVLDCSDGQLARMRKSSSRYGRMLDGAVDSVVQVTAIPAAVWHLVWRMGGFQSSQGIAWGLLSVFAVLAGIRHTTLYDHFKNVYLRNTTATASECDDLDEVEAEWARVRASGKATWLDWVRFPMYKVHLRLVEQTMRWLDPGIPARFADMPAFSPERAVRYRALNGSLMRGWSFFGIGTHIFLFTVCSMLDHIEWYIVMRLVGFNALLIALLPAQRRASRAFFGEWGARSTRQASLAV